jgi:uncharacterized cupin superfamily protein
MHLRPCHRPNAKSSLERFGAAQGAPCAFAAALVRGVHAGSAREASLLCPIEALRFELREGIAKMKKVNVNEIEPLTWESPKGKFKGSGVEVSEALGRDRNSTDLLARHPFDVEILRIPPGHAPYPHHSHSAQWEFYHIISGEGKVRDPEGETRVVTGDAFIFKPGEAHQIINDGAAEMTVYVIADNPVGESWYYPDSGKWGVQLPERRRLRGDALEYYDGEE